MDGICAERRRHCDEKKYQQPIIRTPSLRDRYDRQPRLGGLKRHVTAEDQLDGRSDRVDEEAWKNSCKQTDCGQEKHGGDGKAIRLMRCFRGASSCTTG